MSEVNISTQTFSNRGMVGKLKAVIVGDGVAYEIAEQVALKVKGHTHLTRNSILVDAPSETENNMSNNEYLGTE